MARSRLNKQKLAFSLVAIITLAFAAQILQPQPTSALDKYDVKIQELEKQINEYKGKATELAEKAETLNGVVEQLQIQQDQIQTEIDLNNAKLDRLNEQIAANKALMKQQGAALSKSIASSYITGEPSALEVLANSNTISDFIDNKSQQEALQNQLDSIVDQMNKIKKELEKQISEVESILKAQEVRRNQIAESKQAQQKLLDTTRGEEKEYQNMIQSNSEEIKKQREEQAEARRIQEWLKGQQSSAPNYTGGRMSWPANGTVTSEYGYRIHPVTGVWSFHTGIDVAAPNKSNVFAAADGVVIKVSSDGWGSGYGNYLMVDHGGGVVTLYAHNTVNLAQVGQIVKRGEIIALMGSTGNSTGPHSHFEVRVNGATQNPRDWLY